MGVSYVVGSYMGIKIPEDINIDRGPRNPISDDIKKYNLEIIHYNATGKVEGNYDVSYENEDEEYDEKEKEKEELTYYGLIGSAILSVSYYGYKGYQNIVKETHNVMEIVNNIKEFQNSECAKSNNLDQLPVTFVNDISCDAGC